MAKDKSNGSLGKIALVIVLAIVASGFGTYAWVKNTTDSNGNGVSDLKEILTGKDPLGSGPVATKAPASTTAPGATPSPTSASTSTATKSPATTSPPVTTRPPTTTYPPVTTKPPTTTTAPTATTPPATVAPQGSVQIVSTTMNTLYSSGHPLYQKIFLLQPGGPIRETVTFDVIGAPVEGLSIEFSLLEGGLNAGILRHEVTGGVIPQKTLDYIGYLGYTVGRHTVDIIGQVPAFNPGRDWYEGLVVIRANGKEQDRQINLREDSPTNPKWMTLAYDNEFTSTALVSSIKKEGAGIILYFVTPGLGSTSAVDIYQLSYPGKWRQVYKGEVQPCAAPVTFGGITWPCWVDSTLSSIFIPFSNFAPAKTSESYLKVNAYDSLGNQIDLNAASNDMAARINLPYDVDGGSAWSGTQEYFSVFGVNRFLPFSVLGSNGHPERQYFG